MHKCDCVGPSTHDLLCQRHYREGVRKHGALLRTCQGLSSYSEQKLPHSFQRLLQTQLLCPVPRLTYLASLLLLPQDEPETSSARTITFALVAYETLPGETGHTRLSHKIGNQPTTDQSIDSNKVQFGEEEK